MIKREHLKAAVDAVAERDPEIGYTLDAMLARGRIDIPDPSPDPETDVGDDVCFLFEGRPVAVKRFIYFNEGIVPLEQALVIQYGELAERQRLLNLGEPADYPRVLRRIREAGLRALVDHELDRALNRAAAKGEDPTVIDLLERLRRDDAPMTIGAERRDERILFEGVVDRDIPALITRFPLRKAVLMQAADLNLEFFHVRFLLECIRRGHIDHLLACIVHLKHLGPRLQGLAFLHLKKSFFSGDLEIRYIATARGGRETATGAAPLAVRGAGTLLVAGVWLLWKGGADQARDMILDSEIGARAFYDVIGFSPRGIARYVMGTPGGPLPRAILTILENEPDPPEAVMAAFCGLIEEKVPRLARRREGEGERKRILDFLRACLLAGRHGEFAVTAAKSLLKYEGRIPEAESLLSKASAAGRITIRDAPPPPPASLLLTARDDRFAAHLDNVCHLESPRRYRAMAEALDHPSVAGHCRKVPIRSAAPEELAWVHAPAYIERVAATAGRPLSTFDTDTQASAGSYEAARLAAGAVFALADAVIAGEGKRGFACVRPPGHHAEPDRAMGFCLFNNVALGAAYLKHRRGLDRVMVVDIDAHHGNGIQTAFYDTDEVLYISAHGFPGYPGTGGLGEVGVGRGEGFTVNIPLGRGQTDRAFGRIIHALVRPLAEAYRPGMILVACGFDLYTHDRLGQMNVTPNGYGLMARLLTDIADAVCGGRILFIMEGGYSIRGISECGLRLAQELTDVSVADTDKILNGRNGNWLTGDAVRKVMAVQARYWPGCFI